MTKCISGNFNLTTKGPRGSVQPALTLLHSDKYIRTWMLNPKFHWLRQIATTLSKFHWRFWIFLDAIAKAKKLIRKSIAQNLTDKEFFSFGNGV